MVDSKRTHARERFAQYDVHTSVCLQSEHETRKTDTPEKEQSSASVVPARTKFENWQSLRQSIKGRLSNHGTLRH